MSPGRIRRSLFVALVCSSALTASPLRGDEPPPRPDTAQARAQRFAEAEAHYRARRVEQAREAYSALARLEPLNAHAWLRLGNLHQHAGRDEDALEAYRNASLTVPASRADAQARGKALLNVALLHVAAAGQALDELDAMGSDALADARGEAVRQLGAQRHRALRAVSRVDDVDPRP
jgi:predicted Zn-dependent protease